MKHVATVVAVWLAASAGTAWAGAADERAETQAWAAAALLQEAAPAAQAPPVGLDVRRQDHGLLEKNRSVLKTPLRIGGKPCARGLGTHATSEIVVRLPAAGKRFEAQVGVDDNDDTAGTRGTIVFAVEAAGKEVFRSGVCKGGQAAVPVGVDLAGARELVLRVFDAGDGESYDQADWAEASVMLENGERVWLDEMAAVTQQSGISTAIPFSFVYDGKPSNGLLPTWKRTHTASPAADGRRQHVVAYTDPETGLEVAAEVTLFADYPVAEWVLRLKNTGTKDTPVLEKVLPLDLNVTTPEKGEVVLHHAHGSTCAATDFLPLDRPLAPGTNIDLAPAGGRSSNGRLPFFNLAWAGGGLAGGIGWSGQWAMNVGRNKTGTVTLRMGQQQMHLVLHPGETIRTPRILLVLWKGDDRLHGHNLLRRVLLAHYVPRIDGEIVVPPITHNTWYTFNTGNDVTEQNQIEAMGPMAEMGNEFYWLDAGWFEGGWPSGVGSWVPKAQAFPRGLKPLSDAAHRLGMKFIVWFEPERVHPASRIGKEHPEFVLRAGGGDGLFNLGDPAACQWMTDQLSACIEKGGIDVYRSDYNIDPLPFWQAADAPDRRGMAEIRYVEGHYRMWDDLRRRHPGLWIDNCASGGRRIDLETISRSLPLWRSDTQCCGHAEAIQDQCQTAGLSLYVPLHAGGCWSFDPYIFRSVATTGTNISMDTRRKDTPMDQAKAAIAEAKSLRPLYLGDYYPLTEVTLDERQWIGWQFDRPDLGQGFAMFFRRPKSPYPALDAALRGLEPEATYEVTFAHDYTPGEARRLTGRDLAALRVEISTAPGSVLVRYRKVGK